ncbi:MAG: hypothetical protein U1E22_05440 [Coriobacteriia bacterium]|nr:hypothetical protein [Coriobacteriia bacterium]
MLDETAQATYGTTLIKFGRPAKNRVTENQAKQRDLPGCSFPHLMYERRIIGIEPKIACEGQCLF